jgi:hypothetical protein
LIHCNNAKLAYVDRILSHNSYALLINGTNNEDFVIFEFYTCNGEIQVESATMPLK